MTRPTVKIGQTWTTPNGDSFTVNDIYLAKTWGKGFSVFAAITRHFSDGPVNDTIMAETLGEWFEQETFTIVHQAEQEAHA
jgi:hypothetical protein